MKYVIKKYLFIALVFLKASCSPIVENRGYVFDEKLLDQIKINETISNDVMDILGSPSTTSAIDASTWYYIYSQAETVAFYRPTVTDRRVLAVSFDNNNKVNNLKYYGLEEGKIISYVDRTTPTRGRELTVLQQLFGNMVV